MTLTSLKQLFVELIGKSLHVPDVSREHDSALAYREEIVGHMVPTVAGWRVDEPSTPGHSKIGGLPDLPADVAWPSDAKGRPRLSFLLQINLAEIAGVEHDNPLPRTGMLYLFALCDKNAAQSYSMDSRNTRVVFVPEPGPLAPRNYPEGLPKQGRLDETVLHFGPSLYFEERVEPTEDDEPNVFDDDGEPVGKRPYYRAKRFDNRVESELEVLLRQHGSHTPELTLVKQPWFFQDEAVMQFDPDQEIELLSVHGEHVSPHYYGCVFHIVISRAALTRGALDQAFVIFEAGT